MSLSIEFKKAKRTGLVPAFVGGGILAAAFPIVNMAVRSELYTDLPGTPVRILFDANWSMMAMLNLLLVTVGASLLYNAEYENNALQKMCSLPARESGLFFGKLLLMAVLCTMALTTEALGTAFCTVYWFGQPAGLSATLSAGFLVELLQSFGYELLLLLPAAALSLLLASVCRNMWISLGIGVICVFIATMLPTGRFLPSCFPYAMPFRILSDAAPNCVRALMIAAILELSVISLGEILMIKIRRSLT